MTGEADGPPMLASVAIGDTVTAFSGVIGALAACWSRDVRGRSGAHVDVSMYEPILAIMAGTIAGWDGAGEPPRRNGSRVPGGVPRNVYRTLDDAYVALSGTTDSQVARVLAVIGRDDDADRARFGTAAARLQVGDELDGLVADWIRAHPRDAVLDAFVGLAGPRVPGQRRARHPRRPAHRGPGWRSRPRLPALPSASTATRCSPTGSPVATVPSGRHRGAGRCGGGRRRRR